MNLKLEKPASRRSLSTSWWRGMMKYPHQHECPGANNWKKVFPGARYCTGWLLKTISWRYPCLVCVVCVCARVCVSGLQSWPSREEKQDWSIFALSVYVDACKALLSAYVVTCVTVAGTHMCMWLCVCNKTEQQANFVTLIAGWTCRQNCSGCIICLRTGRQI